MRETRAVPTPHKSPVRCPIWLAAFPPKNGTAAWRARAAKVRPGKRGPGVSPPGLASPRSGGLPPPLFQRFLPRGTHLCSHFFHLDALPPFFPLPSALSHAKASTGDLSGGPGAPPATSKPTAKGKPTRRPHPPLECLLLRSFRPGSSSKCRSGWKVRLSLLPPEDGFCLRLGFPDRDGGVGGGKDTQLNLNVR